MDRFHLKSFGLVSLFFILTSCVSTPLVDRIGSTSICENGQCNSVKASDAPVVLGRMRDFIKDGLTKSFNVCEANPGSTECSGSDVGIFVMGGPIPGRGAMKNFNFLSITEDEAKHALNVSMDTDLTFVGVPLACSSGEGSITVDSRGRLILEVKPHYCNWALVGSVFSSLSFVMDKVDFTSRSVTGYWSTVISGVGNGKGDGYAHFKVPDTRLSQVAVAEISKLTTTNSSQVDFEVSKAPSSTKQAKRVALVIGNGAYPELPLANTIKDAQAMTKTLEALGFQVDKIYDGKYETIKSAIKEFYLNSQGSEVIVLYYAGHGVEVNGRNYLIATDVNFGSAEGVLTKSVDVNKVLSGLGMATDKPKVVILDACRDNPFPEKYKRQSHGLAQMDAPIETFIAFSTSPGKVAEDGNSGNSPYTKSLAQRLNKATGSGIEQLFKEVRKDVVTETAGRQTPWENTSLTSDVKLAK